MASLSRSAYAAGNGKAAKSVRSGRRAVCNVIVLRFDLCAVKRELVRLLVILLCASDLTSDNRTALEYGRACNAWVAPQFLTTSKLNSRHL